MMPLVELRYLIRASASRETCVPPADLWTPANPLYGHCAVAAALTEDFCGGTTKRGVIPGEWQERLGFRSHYWNILPDGSVADLSKEQFPADFPYDAFIRGEIGSEFSTDVRPRILGKEDTRRRYETLKERVETLLKQNPIFSDSKFQRCWELAFSEKAKCAKMRFACLVYQEDRLIVQDVNRLMTAQFGKERFCALDGSRCIRLELPHRVDPSFGDCGHAAIWCLQKVFELGFRPSELDRLQFFEAGFYPDGAPWFRERPEYTCASCENLFVIFGLNDVLVPFSYGWVSCAARESFYSSADYMLGVKKQ